MIDRADRDILVVYIQTHGQGKVGGANSPINSLVSI